MESVSPCSKAACSHQWQGGGGGNAERHVEPPPTQRIRKGAQWTRLWISHCATGTWLEVAEFIQPPELLSLPIRMPGSSQPHQAYAQVLVVIENSMYPHLRPCSSTNTQPATCKWFFSNLCPWFPNFCSVIHCPHLLYHIFFQFDSTPSRRRCLLFFCRNPSLFCLSKSAPVTWGHMPVRVSAGVECVGCVALLDCLCVII